MGVKFYGPLKFLEGVREERGLLGVVSGKEWLFGRAYKI